MPPGSAGADPEIVNREGRTPIQIAVFLDRGDLYDLLVDNDHLERLLDQALEATFPASDPIAVSQR